MAVELQGGAANDEADSALLSESDEEAGGGGGGGEERDGCDDYAASDNEDSDSEGEAHRKRQKKKQERRAQQQDLNFAAQAAAFGTTNALFGDADSDSESARSRTSSKRKRDNMKEAFPLKGIHCVGCSLATRIGPVEKFVNDYMGKMSENALWKSAALVWKRDVVEPAAREGVEVVEWSWKALATHFKLHTTNSVVGRTSMINSLTAMRMQVEQRLLRIEGEDCELDAKNADLCLKVNRFQLEQTNLESVLGRAGVPGVLACWRAGLAGVPGVLACRACWACWKRAESEGAACFASQILAAESRERTLLASGGVKGGVARGGQRPAGEE